MRSVTRICRLAEWLSISLHPINGLPREDFDFKQVFKSRRFLFDVSSPNQLHQLKAKKVCAANRVRTPTSTSKANQVNQYSRFCRWWVLSLKLNVFLVPAFLRSQSVKNTLPTYHGTTTQGDIYPAMYLNDTYGSPYSFMTFDPFFCICLTWSGMIAINIRYKCSEKDVLPHSCSKKLVWPKDSWIVSAWHLLMRLQHGRIFFHAECL